jgi:hypothetical protein
MRSRLGLRLRDERGAVTLTIALAFPFFLAFLAMVLTAGDWWVHQRHLQTQADAAALAAAQDFQPSCTSLQSHMESVVADWGGTRNTQVEDTQANVHFLVNSPTYYGQSAADDTPASDPCTSQMVDVKATEDGLVGPISVGFIPKINAHARVQFFKAQSVNGALPIAVPEPAPKSVRAYFIDESNGSTIGSAALTANGLDAKGNQIWDNSGAPFNLSPTTSQDKIGMRIALGGASSTTCGDPLVDCYDGATGSSLQFIHGYSGLGNAAQPNKPIIRGVTLSSTSCDDPYFSAMTSTCNVSVQANVDFGTAGNPTNTDKGSPPGVGAYLRVNSPTLSSPVLLSYSSSTGTWSSPESIPVPAGGGTVPITIDWAETVGKINGSSGQLTCSLPSNGDAFKNNGGNANLCQGTFGVVQRSFSGNSTLSGPITMVQTWRNGVAGAGNSLRECDSGNSSCPPGYPLVVKVTTQASLAVAHSASDPLVTLRTGDQNQTQALDCDPAYSNLKDEVVAGCSPYYARNTGTACPDSKTTLWGSAQPWTCVAVSTGTATNQIASGLNQRILGDAQATTCTAPNRYASEFANGWDRNDPRIVSLLLTPYGSFSGTGSTTVPVIDFATFYITGWAGQGAGFNNPCSATDDPPGGKGNIVGHFISYADLSGTPGTGACDPNALTPCLGVMTR